MDNQTTDNAQQFTRTTTGWFCHNCLENLGHGDRPTRCPNCDKSEADSAVIQQVAVPQWQLVTCPRCHGSGLCGPSGTAVALICRVCNGLGFARFDGERVAPVAALATAPEALAPSTPAEEDPRFPSLALVAAERRRQVEQEGFTAEHDDDWRDGELARAGERYAHFARSGHWMLPGWPWNWDWSSWKPARQPDGGQTLADQIHNLTVAAALLCAEVDRLDRVRAREQADD